MGMLVVSTDAGDIAIQEHEISTITAAELCELRMSRADLRRLFAEAAKLLLRDQTPRSGPAGRDPSRRRPLGSSHRSGPRTSPTRSLSRPIGSRFLLGGLPLQPKQRQQNAQGGGLVPAAKPLRNP